MTAEKYERPPEVEAALASLPPSGDEGYLDAIRSVPIEAVVVVHREATDQTHRDRIAGVLVERSEPRVRAAAARHSKALPGEIEDVESELRARFWEKIRDESFFEVRFNKAMMRLAQTVGRDARRGKRGELERSAARLGPPGSDADEIDDTLADITDSADPFVQVENEIVIDQGLAALPDEQAKALALHCQMELPIYSRDPGVEDVASVLGYGERKTRELIAEGLAAWRRWFREDDDG